MTTKAKILIVDDEANTLASLARAFRLAGHEAVVCDNAARGLEVAQTQPFDLILSDVVMPRRDGLALLEDLKAAGVTAPVVMMSGQAHIEMAVRATRLGALDFLEKPLSTDKLLVTLENALKLTSLEAENRDLRMRVGKHTLVWTGETMRRVMAQIERVAASESRVCIYGETGTGKELVARTLHEKSHRSGGPFVALNCPSCCACSKKARWSASALTSRPRWTCASSWPRTAISNNSSRPAHSAATSIIGWSFFLWSCRRCTGVARTCRGWWSTSLAR